MSKKIEFPTIEILESMLESESELSEEQDEILLMEVFKFSSNIELSSLATISKLFVKFFVSSFVSW